MYTAESDVISYTIQINGQVTLRVYLQRCELRHIQDGSETKLRVNKQVSLNSANQAGFFRQADKQPQGGPKK